LANAQNCATSGPEEISAAQILIKAAIIKIIPKIISGIWRFTWAAQIFRISCMDSGDFTLLAVTEVFP
jgi:hypothetical protein